MYILNDYQSLKNLTFDNCVECKVGYKKSSLNKHAKKSLVSKSKTIFI